MSEGIDATVLVANRGEIAIRVMRAASELGIRTCAVFSEDDAGSLHVRRADHAHQLTGRGAAAYLDGDQILAIAEKTGCSLLHPGYGFLSENGDFARRCAQAGVTFVGPSPEVLDLFGDKVAARTVAARAGVPVPLGSSGPCTLLEARDFLGRLGDGGAVMIKAVTGGGGRGVAAVFASVDLDDAFERCQSEARAASGNADVYVEQLIRQARHVEVQVIGDAGGTVTHIWDRECSVQRRNQKLIEIAPAPGLSPRLHDLVTSAAVRMAEAVSYSSLGTFEFLVGTADDRSDPPFMFIEANPRLQVEHTVTEEATGVDLVVAQLRVASGATLHELGLTQAEIPPCRGFAIQARVNAETMDRTGAVRSSGGTFVRFAPPTGPGVRTDTAGYSGYRTNSAFDSLVAKVIAHSTADDFTVAAHKLHRALGEFDVDGVDLNIDLLRVVLLHPAFLAGTMHTQFVEDQMAELAELVERDQPGPTGAATSSHASGAEPTGSPRRPSAPEGTTPTPAPMQGTVVAIAVDVGDAVHSDTVVAVMEAMKMEHTVRARTTGVVHQIAVQVGETVGAGDPLVFVLAADVDVAAPDAEAGVDLAAIRPDLAEVLERQELTLDAARPDAVARRRKIGHRTARENVDDLCDPGTFVEYGSLVIAAQRARRSEHELIEKTPADGLVSGIGAVNGEHFDDAHARCAVLSYDYTVLAGTQGYQNHRKKDRLFEIIERLRLPVVFFTEGGGGRPGDTDTATVSGLDCRAFALFGALSGLVPTVGIVSGRCFAGNAAILGCCDVIIATQDANIGMGGPAMIEGGGLGTYRPEEVGPVSVQGPNGVVDISVADEAEATLTAKRYLSFFQGPLTAWDCADQRLLRSLIPENRLRVYDVRRVIETMADSGSVLELRRQFAPGMITSLARFEGRPVGVIANNPVHLGGAIDSDGADKAARFMQLCDAFDLPLLFLCDTPGFMVGPDAEKTAQVRHFARMFVTGGSLTVPFFTIVLRKGYGLGAQAMAGGSFHAPLFVVSWPTGEFGGMGLEGAVRLGFRRELDAITDPLEREEAFDRMVARAYQHGKALNVATYFEIDDVIDPVDSRRRILSALRAAPCPVHREGKKRPCVDSW